MNQLGIGCFTEAVVRYRHRVASTRKLVATLTRPGPHRVLRGDLAFAGLPGVVYTPETGLNLPGLAFGHDWLTGVERSSRLLEHLASWGIVAAAPDTERVFAPSVLNLAFDLGTALDIAAGVRLGPGKISVHPNKLGVIGHGFGGSAAVVAAAGVEGHAKKLRSNALDLWRAWDMATLRVINKAQPGGLAEGRRLTTAFGLGGPD